MLGSMVAMQVDAANDGIVSPGNADIRADMVKALTRHPVSIRMLRDPEVMRRELDTNIRAGNFSDVTDEPFQPFRVNDLGYPGDIPVKIELATIPPVVDITGDSLAASVIDVGIASSLINGTWCSTCITDEWLCQNRMPGDIFKYRSIRRGREMMVTVTKVR